MATQYSEVVQTAQEYYNSDDADNFYFHIWGGEDIHVGIYSNDTEAIAVASQRTVDTMAKLLGDLPANARFIDLGAGYGGAARYLARKFGSKVHCINLSETQNRRNRELTREQGLADWIEVTDGSFENLPDDDGLYDVAWSQDSFLHSGARAKVMDEIDRVLKPGGKLIFTDPMQADDCPEGVLKPVLDRIHLDSLGSVAFYRQQAKRLGWQELEFVDLTDQLVKHYGSVRRELRSRRQELTAHVSEAYIDRMIEGLGHWVSAGEQGYLAWGILLFEKPQN
ncbi:MAG: methyltransferase domain-containing protein [Pseudomonadales bacterium]|nr:methyltransferase domain-containing protein [Pseudomonadales bacterium]